MSLQDQLNVIAESNASLAIDRKRRQKLHSQSLIYNPKTAATQDYDYIFENAQLALQELVNIDNRFQAFVNNLFSDSSVSIDRNVQTPEDVAKLNQVITNFLLLTSAYWHLSPTVHATEWLVRRFQINIHNSETFLLSTINYYQTPIFRQILKIVKLPKLFSPLSSFVKNSDSAISNLTILKLFNDLDFIRLFTEFLSQSIRNNMTYQNQLLFTSCTFINIIAWNKTNNDKRLNELIPICLELSAKLLDVASSDCQIAAHTILLVLSSAIPLQVSIIYAAMETIIANLKDQNASRSALITIIKMFQTVQNDKKVEFLSLKLFTLFDKSFTVEQMVAFIRENKDLHLDKFITIYIRSIARYNQDKLNSMVDILRNVSLEKYELQLIITDMIHLTEITDQKDQLLEIFEFLVKDQRDLILSCLEALNIPPQLFEVKLTTSLFEIHGVFQGSTEYNTEDENQFIKKLTANTNQKEKPNFQEFIDKNAKFINISDTSVLSSSDELFNQWLKLFLDSTSKGHQPGLFLTSFFTTLEARITFLVRVASSPASPSVLKAIALSNILRCFNSIDSDSNIFTLVPCLIPALINSSKNVRTIALKVLKQISKRPFTKRYFLADKLYGNDVQFAKLNPKDAEAWLNLFLDEYMPENSELSKIFVPKKNHSIYIAFWANQALTIPLPHIKIEIMEQLHNSTSSPSTYSSVFEDFLKKYLTERNLWCYKCKNNKTSLMRFEKCIAGLISNKEKNDFIINFAIDCFQSQYEDLANVIANRITEVFTSLKENYRTKLAQCVLDTAVDSNQSFDATLVFQNLPLGPEVFVSLLTQNSISQGESSDTKFLKKRRRRSSSNKSALQIKEVSEKAEIHLRKLTVILETLDKSHITGTEALLESLFVILFDLENLHLDGGLPALYALETLTSCMINAIDSMKEQGIHEISNIRADILVSALRNSSSPQVQNKLLLVIGALATLNSEVILHSIMPIFTFMGAHSIRQDDEFTSQVVQKTVTAVVPALLNRNDEDKGNNMNLLLMSFATALQHIPKHRRVNIFTNLIKALGAMESLGSFMFLVSQQYSSLNAAFKLGEAKNIIEFTKAFLLNFSTTELLNGISDFFNRVKIVIKMARYPESKPEFERLALFSNGVVNYSSTELFSLIKNSFIFMKSLTQENKSDYYDIHGSLKLRVLTILLDDQSEKAIIEDVKSKFGSILEHVLGFINRSDFSYKAKTVSSGSDDDEPSDNETSINEFKNEIKNSLFDLLSNLLQMLPVNDFVHTILPLIRNSDNDDIKYHLGMIVTEIFENQSTDDSVSAAIVIMKILLERIPAEKGSLSVVQCYLNSIASIIKRYGNAIDQSVIKDSLSLATEMIYGGEKEIIISSLAIITNCFKVLRVSAISFYPKVVPTSLKIFHEYVNEKFALKPQLELSILLLFAGMIKSIPNFVMSNLFDIFDVLFFSNEVEISTRLAIGNLIVDNMDSEGIIRILAKIWNAKLINSNEPVSISLFLSTLEATVKKIDKKSAISQSPTFYKLLLSLLEYRSISKFDNNTISRIEASIFEVANTYTLKMNDKIFRPLFFILVRWAFEGEGVKNRNITEVQRLTSFFKFFNRLQENLRGIITTYFNYLLEPVTKLLKQFLTQEKNDVNLRRLVLMSLTSAFKCDKDDYWKSTSRFEIIVSDLVNQLSNIEPTLGKYLVKSIVALAAKNSGVEEHSKIINKLVVEHMKSSCSSTEKLWSIKTMKLIYSKLGENWLTMLPQMVPVIAELLEDENEDVELEVRTGLVKVVEGVLGEPFDRYLN